MTDEEANLTIGLLMLQAREERGLHRRQASDRMGVNYGTLSRLEKAENIGLTNRTTFTAVEMFYGWRIGCLMEIWKNRADIELGSITKESLLPPEKTGVALAADLTDEQLIAELSFRFLMRDRRAFDF